MSGLDEKRGTQRQPILKAGTISFDGSGIDCLVRNMSDEGANLEVESQTGIPNSVDAGALVSGYPAIPNRDWLKASAIFRQLPDLRKRVADLEARLAALEGAPRTRGERGEE